MRNLALSLALAFAFVTTACRTAASDGATVLAAASDAKYKLEATFNADASAADVVLKQGTEKVASFSGCAKTDGTPDMFPDITWELCTSDDYEIEIDNPSHLSTDYKASMTFPGKAATPGILFACKLSDDAAKLTCKETGKMSAHANPHTSVGVSN